MIKNNFNNLEKYLTTNSYAIALKLTALELILCFYLNAIDEKIAVIISTIALPLILIENLKKKYLFWFAITLILGCFITYNWWDTHSYTYLLFFWLINVCVVSYNSRDLRVYFYQYSQFFLCLTLFFGVYPKLSNPAFRSGSVMELILVIDQRTKPLWTLTGGAKNDFNINHENNEKFLSDPSQSFVFKIEKYTKLAAKIITYWTLFIEILLFILFLIPKKYTTLRLMYFKHGLYLTFLGSTFYFLPVIPFAFVLTIVGFVQCAYDEVKMLSAYFVMFILINLLCIRLVSH